MKPLVVFAYNFPHKKTQDILLRLFCLGYPVGWVIASNPQALNIPPPSVRTKIRHVALLHPEQIASRIGAKYIVAAHNSEEVYNLLGEIQPHLGVIAGARILKPQVIDQFKIGIINLHPGLIPEVRGLDAMMWAIYHDLPLGVTAHLIDHRVDAGRILLRKPIPLFPDDTLLDLSERLFEYQLEILGDAIERALLGQWHVLDPQTLGRPNRKMPPELEAETLRRFETYKAKMLHKGQA